MKDRTRRSGDRRGRAGAARRPCEQRASRDSFADTPESHEGNSDRGVRELRIGNDLTPLDCRSCAGCRRDKPMVVLRAGAANEIFDT